MRTFARVEVSGVPANWSQHRGHSQVRDAEKRPWRDRTWFLAQSARNDAGWPLPVRAFPPVQRWLVVQVYKRAPLYDEDGLVSSLKPVIDGLVGVLLVDDGPAWCAWAGMPDQHVVDEERAERVVIEVHLVDPRAAAGVVR